MFTMKNAVRLSNLEERVKRIEAALGVSVYSADFYTRFPSFTVEAQLDAHDSFRIKLLKYFDLCVTNATPGGEIVPCDVKQEGKP